MDKQKSSLINQERPTNKSQSEKKKETTEIYQIDIREFNNTLLCENSQTINMIIKKYECEVCDK